VVIPSEISRPNIVVTNGYHITRCYEVACQHLNVYFLKVDCAIDDNLVVTGAVLMALFYAVGLTSGILFLQFLSFVPILYFLYLFYINRKDFIQIRLANSL